MFQTCWKTGNNHSSDRGCEKYLAHKGFDPKYGARQVAGVIRNYLRRPISRLIISGKLSKGDTLKVSMGENEELTWDIENTN